MNAPHDSDPDRRAFLIELLAMAVAAADPEAAVRAHLPAPPPGRTIVVGAGKAAARMARALDAAWPAALSGVVVTPYGSALETGRINVLEASHPVPDDAGLAAAERLLSTVGGLGADDLVIALISGGASALLPAPAGALTLADEQAVNRTLLASGLPIAEMNTVRTALSRIKGGRLALAALPARVETLVISDVPGDDPALVGSGPTVPQATLLGEAARLVRRRGLPVPPRVMAVLDDEPQRPLAGDPRLARNRVSVIASARLSLAAAADAARAQGLDVTVLSDALEGEARELGRAQAEFALARPRSDRPQLLLSGGETTVTLRGSGRGGRNSEFMLAFALAIAGRPDIVALAADTDGIDGTGGHAGAYADGGSAQRMRAAGVDPTAALARNDSHAAFAAIGDLVTTGPTGTNVNDFRAVLIG